jgi:hypothetical protein
MDISRDHDSSKGESAQPDPGCCRGGVSCRGYPAPITVLLGLLLSSAVLAESKSYDASVPIPPLNTSILYTRGLSAHGNVGSTANVMALVMDVDAERENSYFAWPLYVQLTTNQKGGDATVFNGRGYQNSVGGWMASSHSELIQDGSDNVGIGVNAEISKLTPSGRAIGFNVQATNGYNKDERNLWSTEAINIQAQNGSGWVTGINFDTRSIKTGIALSGNSIAFDPGRRFVMQYNPAKKKLEILLDGKPVWVSKAAK